MVKIIDGWYYEVEEKQYTLIHQYNYEGVKFGTKEKTGEVKQKNEIIGYYVTLSEMLIKLTKLLAKEKVDNGEIKTIEEHVQALRTIKNELEEILNPF